MEGSTRRGLSIRAQTLMLTAVPLLFLILLFSLSTQLAAITQQGAASQAHAEATLAAAEAVSALVDEANRSAVEYARTRRAAVLAPLRAKQREAPARMTHLVEITQPNPAVHARALRLNQDVREALDLIGRFAALSQAGKRAQAEALDNAPATVRLARALQNDKADFDAAQRESTLARLGTLRSRLQGFSKALLAAALTGIVLTLAIALRYGVGIARRLRLLAANARRLASGETTVPIAGRDEIGELDGVMRASFAQREAALAAYEREHRVASELQSALLPHDFPQVAGLRVDSAYLPAAAGAEIGGDWFDLFVLDDRHVGLSVGDVAGHGLRAAIVMGSVRQAIRNAMRIERAPSSVLRHVNAMLCADNPGTVVTAFCAVLDTGTGELVHASAGHVPPMVVRAGGVVELLRGDGLVLGLDTHTRYDDARARLDIGSALVLYTDGIVEVQRDYFAGVRDLEQAVRAEYADPSPNIARGLQERIFSRSEPRDDSAVLFVGVTSLGARAAAQPAHSWEFDARDAASVHRVRRALLWQIAGLAAGESEYAAIELIYGELVSNVARHTEGRARVTFEQTADGPLLHVDDRGAAFAPERVALPDVYAESGRGLFLVRALALRMTVSRTEHGNRTSVLLPAPARDAA